MNRYNALLKVIETGSFTKAARILGCTQPALSQIICSLEKEISITLLYRSRSGVRLTPEGERLYPEIKKTVQQLSDLQKLEDRIRQSENAALCIGTMPCVSSCWLPKIIQKFWTVYPNIQIELRQGEPQDICNWIQNDTVDFGFLIKPSIKNGLHYQPIWSDPFVVVLPVNHPFAQRGILSMADLKNEPCLLFSENNNNNTSDFFRQSNIIPNTRFVLSDAPSILSLVERGIGYSLLPKSSLKNTSCHVVALPTREQFSRTISLVTKEKRLLSSTSKLFMQYIRSAETASTSGNAADR